MIVREIPLKHPDWLCSSNLKNGALLSPFNPLKTRHAKYIANKLHNNKKIAKHGHRSTHLLGNKQKQGGTNWLYTRLHTIDRSLLISNCTVTLFTPLFPIYPRSQQLPPGTDSHPSDLQNLPDQPFHVRETQGNRWQNWTAVIKSWTVNFLDF